VALRRMRSALRLFRVALADPRTEQWREALGDTARALGGARDWDVFATEVLPNLRKSFGDPRLARSLASRATARRMKERDVAREALRSGAYAKLVLDLARWLSDDPAATTGAESLTGFASALIRKRHKRLLADARHLAKLSPEERHQIRIDAKRLRYCVDGFASLFKDSRVEKYSRALGRLQDVLGRANDATTAMRLVSELEAPEAFASFARGYLAARAEEDVASLGDHVAALGEAKRFWARKPDAPSVEG
jgi:triphosphatase